MKSRNRSLSQAIRSLVSRRDSNDSSLGGSKSSDNEHDKSASSPITTTSSDEEEEEFFDDEIEYNDARSIIGGHNTTREEQDQAEVRSESQTKTFSFSLPFSNPLASIDLPKLRFFSSHSEPDLEATANHLAAIDSRTEEEIYRNVHNQDNSRMRAVRHALTPSFDSTASRFPQIDGNVVIMGGYRGSILRDKKTNRRVWIPIKVGLNLRKIDLSVGIDDEDEYTMEQKIIPDGMLTHIGPVDVSRKLIRKLASQPKCNVYEFGYDWRLSSDINSKKLQKFLADLPGNSKPIVIAHSMGGLIAHHAMMQNPELFRGILYAGVPSACPNILGPFRYGDSVLLSSRVLTAQVNFLMRSSYAFLPTDGRCFVDRRDPSKKYDLDFFDVNTWIEYGLSPCVAKSAEIRQTQTRSEPVSEKEKSLKHADTFVLPSAEMIPYNDAVSYLDRTLKRTKAFLDELEYDPDIIYPPMAVLYGCKVPTLKGARVDGHAGIKRGDYDDLLFGAGDGVIYHKSLMPVNKGFDVVAKIPSDRGHVTLLNDIEGVGKALDALLEAEKNA